MRTDADDPCLVDPIGFGHPRYVELATRAATPSTHAVVLRTGGPKGVWVSLTILEALELSKQLIRQAALAVRGKR